MFISTPSTSFNLTSIEKKLAAIQSTSSTSYPIKTTKFNNETELDAHLKSERAAFNDEQFEFLTQQVSDEYLKNNHDDGFMSYE
jgi:hypothetical protein